MSTSEPQPQPQPSRNDESQTDEPSSGEDDKKIRLTPGLVLLGILAVALGVFSAIVMSARALAP